MTRIIIVFWVLICFFASASAGPIEARSENFVFAWDTSEKNAISLIEGLENYRAILFTIYNMDPGPELIPVKIYGFKTQSRIEKVSGRDNIGGLYTTTLEGPVFLLTTEGGFKEGKPARQTAYHEYTHHILASFTHKHYPRWYNEGYADYLSTFTFNSKKREFEIGLPTTRGWTLASYKWLPIDVIINSVRKYPFKNQGNKSNDITQSLFYAQSWLAAHFIQSTDGYPKKMQSYIDLINRPDAPANAFEITMGVTHDEFAKLIKAYYDKKRVSYVRAKVDDDFRTPKVTVQKISKAKLKYHYGEAVRHVFDSEESRELAKAFLDEAEEDLGQTADILTSRGLLALDSGDYKLAIKLAEKVLERMPESGPARRTLGMAQIQAYKALGTQEASVEAARKNLFKAMKANPDDVTAHYFYARSFSTSTPSKQAIASARGVLDYFRSLNFLVSNLEMAEILLTAGAYEEAKLVFEKALVWSQDSGLRRYARERLDVIERY